MVGESEAAQGERAFRELEHAGPSARGLAPPGLAAHVGSAFAGANAGRVLRQVETEAQEGLEVGLLVAAGPGLGASQGLHDARRIGSESTKAGVIRIFP